MMKSERKRGNPVVTVILVLIVLILGVAGGMYLSRTVDGGFLGTLLGKAPASYETEANPQQAPIAALPTAPVVNPAGELVPGAASAQVPEPAQAVPNPNVVEGDGALTAQDGVDVLTPAAVTIIQLPAKAGDEVSRGDVLARVDRDKLRDTLSDLKAQRDQQEKVVKSLSGEKASETVYSPVKGRVKKVYADEGEDVQTVMSRDGALALMSTDGLMKVTFVPGDALIRVGAAVTVKDDRGNEWDGRVASLSGATGEITVTFSDDGPELDENVSVYLGALIGTGTAKINSPLTITATGGTVDKARYLNKENASVSKGTALFDLSDVPISDGYKSALTKRQDILDQITQAEGVLDSGEITALDPQTLKSIRRLFNSPDAPVDLSQFQVRPSIDHLSAISELMGEPSLLRSWLTFNRNINYGEAFVSVLPDELAEWIELIDDPKIPLWLRWTFACTPIRGGFDSPASQHAQRWIKRVAEGHAIPMPRLLLGADLASLESTLHVVETYLHLARSLPEHFPQHDDGEEARKLLNDAITRELSRQRKPRASKRGGGRKAGRRR